MLEGRKETKRERIKMKNFKPMLAGKIENINTIEFPVIASPKLDGVRAIIIDGVVMSRSLKPIPNKHVQELFGVSSLNGLDGELIVGNPCDEAAFRTTTSGVMSKGGTPDVKFYVFDDTSKPEESFLERLALAQSKVNEHCVLVPQVTLNSLSELENLENEYLGKGYEGVMVRTIDSPYKFGRSTATEAYLLKLKRFCDSEAEILGFEEQMINTNAATTDELGHIKRSMQKEGLEGKGTLGAIRVRDLITKVEFSIGTGIDEETRSQIWSNQAKHLSDIIKYKFFPSGNKEKPRFPVFQGFRSALDM